jgi:hypothetical protein
VKRLVSNSLWEWLATTPGRNCLRADLFQIELPNGQTINATSGQWGITVPSGTNGWINGAGTNLPTTTFHAADYGVWSRGAITSQGGFNFNGNTMDLTCVPQPSTTYPGLELGLLAAARQGLFRGAMVTVWTAYMPQGEYGNVSQGIETKFTGYILKNQKLNRLSCTFDVGDPCYLLKQKVPTRLFQPMDPCTVTDPNFGLNLAGTDINGYEMTQAFTCTTGSTQYGLIPATAFTQPEGYFTQGIVTCTAGANAGFSQTVKVHESGVLVMMNPWVLPPVPGTDTFSVIVGYDGTLTTCINKFGNEGNFQGTPFLPPANRSI